MLASKRVLFPLVPEYIGYANQSVTGDMFCSVRPHLDLIGDHEFKYRVDFDALRLTPASVLSVFLGPRIQQETF